MREYELYLKKREEAVNKYCNLPLKEFLRCVLQESGGNLNRLDNVYIDEIVQLPSVWGCYKKDNKYVTYYTNEYGQIDYIIYEDPIKFMNAFITNSTFFSKSDILEERKKTL